MSKIALIVIDVQNYFINRNTEHLPEKIARFIGSNKFDYILFTQFVNHSKSNFAKMLGWEKCNSSPAIDIHSALVNYVKKKNTFTKDTLSAFKSEELKKFLKKNKVEEVYLCGTDSEACVLSSAFEAFDLGFRVHILKELCASTNGKEFHEYARTIMERNLERAPTI
ncbi:cysteine hydrolase [Candidatus Micrarchaeota archaeon]|nr:cysteine hydrolase [Candidatus Micrarchaeota archaeon]